MKKGKVFAVAGVTLLAADCWLHVLVQTLAKRAQAKTKTMVMSTQMILKLWTTLCLLKLLHMISLQTS